MNFMLGKRLECIKKWSGISHEMRKWRSVVLPVGTRPAIGRSARRGEMNGSKDEAGRITKGKGEDEDEDEGRKLMNVFVTRNESGSQQGSGYK